MPDAGRASQPPSGGAANPRSRAWTRLACRSLPMSSVYRDKGRDSGRRAGALAPGCRSAPKHRNGATSNQRLPSPTQNPTDTMQTQTPQPNNPSPTIIPALLTRHSRPLHHHSRVVGSKMRLGVRQGVNPSPFLKQSKPCLKSQNNQNPHPRATRGPQKISLGVVQSKQLRVQSMFNQRSINVQSKPHPPQPEKTRRAANPSPRPTGLTLNLIGAQNRQ